MNFNDLQNRLIEIASLDILVAEAEKAIYMYKREKTVKNEDTMSYTMSLVMQKILYNREGVDSVNKQIEDTKKILKIVQNPNSIKEN